MMSDTKLNTYLWTYGYKCLG